jgi:hypothetical protein
MEDIITNFEFKNARLIRVCPTCALIQDTPYDLHMEQAVLAAPCPKCGFHFPMTREMADSTAVFRDVDPAVQVSVPTASSEQDRAPDNGSAPRPPSSVC